MKQTKILLISPPVTTNILDYPTLDPPLGLAYLAAVLEEDNFQVKIIDALALGINRAVKQKDGLLKVGMSMSELKKEIIKYQPDVVGISCAYTAHQKDSYQVASLVKKINQKILVIFGGAHATVCASDVLKNKNVDLVVMGEGEIVLKELAECLENQNSYYRVQSIAFRDKDKIVINPRRQYIADLDQLPHPSWHLLPMKIYLKGGKETRDFSMRRPRMNMITSRGCPGNCVFCSIHAIWGHRWRPRKPEKVVEEMELLTKTYNIKEFYILDDNISFNNKRMQAICRLIVKKKLNIRWSVPNGFAFWTLSKHLLNEMKQSGLYRMTFGFESACARTLKFIRKPESFQRSKSLIEFANKIGFWTGSTFIIGFPDETLKEIETTINWAVNSSLDYALFFIATPYPGTDLYSEFVKRKIFNMNESEKMSYNSVHFSGYNTTHINRQKLNQLRNQAYNRFLQKRFKRYLNPYYSIVHLLPKIKRLDELNFFLKMTKSALQMKIESMKMGKYKLH